MKAGKAFAAFVLMLTVAASAGCKGGTESCDDYNRKICEKINNCFSVSESFSQCLNQLNAAKLTDEQCRINWEYVDDTPCDQLSSN